MSDDRPIVGYGRYTQQRACKICGDSFWPSALNQVRCTACQGNNHHRARKMKALANV